MDTSCITLHKMLNESDFALGWEVITFYSIVAYPQMLMSEKSDYCT